MKSYSDFSKETEALEGDKVRIDSIINKEITITGCKIRNSRYSKNESGKYLTLQFKDESEVPKIIFTGSDVLIDQMEKYREELPFRATIKKIDRYYTLS